MRVPAQDQLLARALDRILRDRTGAVAPRRILETDFVREGVDQPRLAARQVPHRGKGLRGEALAGVSRVLR